MFKSFKTIGVQRSSQLSETIKESFFTKFAHKVLGEDLIDPGGCTWPDFGRGHAIEASKTYPFLTPIS